MNEQYESQGPGAGLPVADALNRARFGALSRLVPLMYLILLVNASVLACAFRNKAPLSLTGLPAGVFALIFVARTAAWWRRRLDTVSAEYARRQLRITFFFAASLAAGLVSWGFALYELGDAYDRAHVAFFLAVTLICSMFCLIHASPAPELIAVFAGVPFVVFFGMSDIGVLHALAIDMVLVVGAALIIIRIQARDFTRLVLAQEDTRRREQDQSRLLRMIEDLPIAIMTVEPASLRINFANRAAVDLVASIEHLLPVRAKDLLGTCIDVFHQHPEHQRRLLADPTRLPHSARLRLGGEILDLKASAVRGSDGAYIGPMMTMALVTAQVKAEDRVLQLAHFDALTGLMNRHTFQERLDRQLADGPTGVTLMLVDLDGFKSVNDGIGQAAGDVLLKAAALRLQGKCQAALGIARVAGDEFAVLMPGSDGPAADEAANAVLEALGMPFALPQERQARLGACLGIAIAPEHGGNGETLMVRASIALKAAKAAGRGNVRVFSQTMLTATQRRMSLEERLRAALDGTNELFVFFQPIFDLKTRKVVAREALVRWLDAREGWVSPGIFIPIAEQSGLIDRIGELVLQRAAAEAVGWADGARVAVNISAAQLGKGTLVATVQRALSTAGLPACRLEVEVTETALLTNGDDALAELRQLRSLGTKVALDC